MMLAQGLAITGELGHFEELFNEVVYPTWLLWAVAAVAFGRSANFRLPYRGRSAGRAVNRF